MVRYLFLLILCCQSLKLCAINISVGYENNGTNDIATLWITKNPSTASELTLSSSLGKTGENSRALAIAQNQNLLYIVGYQEYEGNQHATLWTCKLDGSNVTSYTIDNTQNDSSANCMIWSGTCFYAAGFLENNNEPYMNIWQIDIKNQVSISQICTEVNFVSNAFSIGLWLGQIITSGEVKFNESPNMQAAWCQFDPDNGDPSDTGWFRLSNSSEPATGKSLALDLQNSIIYIAGSFGQIGSKRAYIWKSNLYTGQPLDSQSLSQITSEAFDLTLVNNQLYVAGYITNSGKDNACIWTAPTGKLSSFKTFSTVDYLYPMNTRYANCVSSFNFIKGTQESKNLQSFPLYAGGYFTFDLIPDAFYEKFSTTQNIVNFGANNFINPPIVDLSNSVTSYQKEAFDMLINVLSPSKVIYKAIKSNKTLSIQIGTSK